MQPGSERCTHPHYRKQLARGCTGLNGARSSDGPAGPSPARPRPRGQELLPVEIGHLARADLAAVADEGDRALHLGAMLVRTDCLGPSALAAVAAAPTPARAGGPATWSGSLASTRSRRPMPWRTESPREPSATRCPGRSSVRPAGRGVHRPRPLQPDVAPSRLIPRPSAGRIPEPRLAPRAPRSQGLPRARRRAFGPPSPTPATRRSRARYSHRGLEARPISVCRVFLRRGERSSSSVLRV